MLKCPKCKRPLEAKSGSCSCGQKLNYDLEATIELEDLNKELKKRLRPISPGRAMIFSLLASLAIFGLLATGLLRLLGQPL